MTALRMPHAPTTDPAPNSLAWAAENIRLGADVLRREGWPMSADATIAGLAMLLARIEEKGTGREVGR